MAATFAQTFEPDVVRKPLLGGELSLQTHRLLILSVWPADTQTNKLLEGTLFCLELTIDLCTCSAPDTPAIEEVGQCGGDLENNQIICPKSLLVPFSVFHQYNIVVQLLKVTDPKVNWKELLVKQYL